MNLKSRISTTLIGTVLLAGTTGFPSSSSIAQPSLTGSDVDVEIDDIEPPSKAAVSERTCIIRYQQPVRCFRTQAEAIRVTPARFIGVILYQFKTHTPHFSLKYQKIHPLEMQKIEIINPQ